MAEAHESEEEDAVARRWSEGIASGDHAALSEFYEAWFEVSVGIVRAFTGRDEAFCLDVVQDAMVRMTRSMKPMGSAAALRAWVVAVLRSRAIDALRAQRRRTRHEAAVVRGEGESEREILGRIEWLMGMVEGEEVSVQELLRLRYSAGMGLRDAAAVGGRSEGAAHGVLRRLFAAWRVKWSELEDRS